MNSVAPTNRPPPSSGEISPSLFFFFLNIQNYGGTKIRRHNLEIWHAMQPDNSGTDRIQATASIGTAPAGGPVLDVEARKKHGWSLITSILYTINVKHVPHPEEPVLDPRSKECWARLEPQQIPC